jgi:hypothetical protein
MPQNRRIRWVITMRGERLRKLASVPASELLLLLRAQWTLWRIQMRLRVQPPGAIVSAADCVPDVVPVGSAREPQAVTPPELAAARIIERAVLRAATHGISRPLCLARAMALQSMLESAGLRGSRVRMGVRLTDGTFAAHAWVEYGGQVLGDSASHVNGYEALRDARVNPA